VYLETWLDHLTTRHGFAAEDVRAAVASAGQATLRALFGADTPAQCTAPELRQRYRMIVPLGAEAGAVDRGALAAALRAADLQHVLDDVGELEDGMELALPMAWTVPGRDQLRPLEDALRGLLPHDLTHPEFWDQRERDLSDALFRFVPPKPYPAGSGGALLADGGGWFLGLSGSACRPDGAVVRVSVDSGKMRWKATSPNSLWIDAGLTLRVEGVAVDAGDLYPPDVIDADGTLRVGAAISDHEGNHRSWLAIGLDPRQAPDVRARLDEIAASLAEKPTRRSTRWLGELLVAAQPGAAPGSLAEWCRDVLMPALAAEDIALPSHAIQLTEGFFVERATWDRGFGYVQTREVLPDATGRLKADENTQAAGRLSDGGMALPAPSPAVAEQLLAWTMAWRDNIAREQTLCLEHGQPEAARWQVAWPSIRLLDVVESCVRDGLPPTPPVPTPTRGGPARLSALRPDDAARVAAALGDATARAMWTLRAGDWLILLRDSTARAPHSASHISLLGPDDQFITVQSCDVWNPPSRFCLGGDAFAFRRFRQWLIAALADQPELDAVGCFDGEEEYDEELDDEVQRGVRIRASRWMLFDRYETDDRDLLDWRVQGGVIPMGWGIASTAGLYGFSGERVEALEGGHDYQLWRVFLAENVHSGFALTRQDDAR